MLETSAQVDGSPVARTGWAGVLRSAMEAVILAMVVLSPWAFGSVHPASIFLLYCGTSATLILWSAVVLLERRVSIVNCPLLFCFGGLVALGVWQLIPLSPATLEVVSDGTASLRSHLVPQQLESLPGEAPIAQVARTISLDPHATRERVVQFLGLLSVFAATRFAIASPAAFHRFAVACTINGALLCLLALAQRFSSSPETIYWSFPSQGSVYGPFVCRNNFPDYVNVCLFLGIGLLLRAPVLGRSRTTWEDVFAGLGRNPAIFWLVAAVGLMAAGILFSFSRGGAIALGVAAGCCVAMTARGKRLSASLCLLALVAAVALGALVWFGADAVSNRLGSLSDSNSNFGRSDLWARTVSLIGRSPIWGTGYGTFETLEPLTRQPGDDPRTIWEHAHNDYLEAQLEGGVFHLFIVLSIVVVVLWRGWKTVQRLRDHPDGALAIGGLSGFIAVIIHSCGDFGMHIPAVAVLVTVLLAHLSALGKSETSWPTLRSRWLVVPTIAVFAIVAVVLALDGWYRERADYYRLAALRAGNRLPPGDRDTTIRYLQAAAGYSPDDAAIRLRLAETEYEDYLARRDRPGNTPSMQSKLVESYLRPALRNYLKLRASNPLYFQSHARLAGNRQYLEHPDTALNYLDRATGLRPTEEGLWYLAGVERIKADDFDSAWRDWRRSLLCSPAHLKSILPIAVKQLGPAGIANTVLPLEPELLLKAAQSPPLSENQNDRRKFAAGAVERIAELTLTKQDDLYARAWLLREAGRTGDAVTAFEAALLRYPNSLEWRLELAELLFELGNFEDSERQLRKVLQERPDQERARELNAAVVRAKTGLR